MDSTFCMLAQFTVVLNSKKRKIQELSEKARYMEGQMDDLKRQLVRGLRRRGVHEPIGAEWVFGDPSGYYSDLGLPGEPTVAISIFEVPECTVGHRGEQGAWSVRLPSYPRRGVRTVWGMEGFSEAFAEMGYDQGRRGKGFSLQACLATLIAMGARLQLGMHSTALTWLVLLHNPDIACIAATGGCHSLHQDRKSVV